MAGQPTYGGTVYRRGRLMTPDHVRNAPLRRRGLLRRRYDVKEVREFLDGVAASIESRIDHEAGLQHTIGQLRLDCERAKDALRDWNTQQTQAAWRAQHPQPPS